MKTNLRYKRVELWLLCAGLLLLVGCTGAASDGGGGLSAAIVEPADGAQFNLGDLVVFTTTISDPDGATQVVLFANGEPVRVDDLNQPLYQGNMQQSWLAHSEGTFDIQVLFSSGGGQSVSSNTITILIGGGNPAATPTATETSPVEASATPTATPEQTPMVNADVDTNCRSGPSTQYPSQGALDAGLSAPINGRIEDSSWWRITLPAGTQCWVSDAIVEVSGDTSQVPVLEPPPLPTSTPTSTPAPLTAPNPVSPSGTLNCAAASSGVTLQWEAVTHPNGIDHYEWSLEGPINDSGTTTNLQATTISLSCAGANYQWRVRAVDGTGEVGPWSSYLNFNVP